MMPTCVQKFACAKRFAQVSSSVSGHMTRKRRWNNLRRFSKKQAVCRNSRFYLHERHDIKKHFVAAASLFIIAESDLYRETILLSFPRFNPPKVPEIFFCNH